MIGKKDDNDMIGPKPRPAPQPPSSKPDIVWKPSGSSG